MAHDVERDRHVRRSGDDYATAFLSLLPVGPAWPRDPESTLARACDGLSRYWGTVDGRAADLLERESDPRKTFELLTDWEDAWGLPDPCFKEPQTLGERRAMLLLRMTMLGGQSREFFYKVASWLGYTIRIGEFAPYMTGISQCGDVPDAIGKPRWQLGPPEIRFYWTCIVDNAKLTWFRTSPSGGEVGVDPHLIIGLATDLECVLNRWKPAHTLILYDYSGLVTGGSMAGTP
jgi:uncharacterized protein YmfQ (DUF2313 family)